MTTGPYRSRGFTLVELMIAMTLGTVLVLLLVVIFTTAQQHFRLQTQLAELQDNAAGALTALAKELRVVGYLGCVNEGAVDVGTVFGSPFVRAYSTPQAYRTGVSPTRPDITSQAFTGVTGPILEVTHASYRSVPATSVSTTQVRIAADPYGWFSTGGGAPSTRRLVVSSCADAKPIQATWSSEGGAFVLAPDTSLTLVDSSPSSARVYSLESSVFFLATPTGRSTPSLYQRYFDGRSTVDLRVADNVERWDLTFSVADDTGVITQVDQTIADLSTGNAAAILANWQSVQSVQARLLLRSTDKVVPTSATYLYNYQEQAASDQRLRKEAVGTIAIRNRTNDTP